MLVIRTSLAASTSSFSFTAAAAMLAICSFCRYKMGRHEFRDLRYTFILAQTSPQDFGRQA